MTSFIAPGVYTVERDLSQYVSDLSSTIVGMVGTSEKGPVNSPILVTSAKEYVDIFGQVNPKHYMGYAAISFLKKGSMLWVNRVGASDASTAICSFPLPKAYTQYAGLWELVDQTATDITLELTDYSTASGVNKTIVLDGSTVLPDFDITDSDPNSTTPSTGKVGADFKSFIASPANAVGNYVTITLGAGKGTSAMIKSVGGTATPNVVVPISSFKTTNSPATAYAAGTLNFLTPATFSLTTGNPIMTLGVSSAATTSKNITLNYVTGLTFATVLSNLKSAVTATKLAQLETLVTAVVHDTTYQINIPLLDPTVSANAYANNDMLYQILSGLLGVVNLSAAPAVGTYPKLNVFYTDLRILVGSSYGIGSLDADGYSQGFKAVNISQDATGNITQIRLSALAQGLLGAYTYTVNAATVLQVSNQTVSGSFTAAMYRPTWDMVEAGTSIVPTILKFSSIGQSDSSNIGITLSIDQTADGKTEDGIQKYGVKVYERKILTSVSNTSVKYSDFNLVEQYDGIIDNIQSNIAKSSRRISLKIDYTTTDTLNMATGAVTPSTVSPEGFVFSPVFIPNDSGAGVVSGITYAAAAVGYEKVLTSFLEYGSVGTTVTKEDVIGDSAEGTGIYTFANPETVDINVLIAPGWSADPAVGKAMAALCENRGDVIAILDTPFGLSVQDAINYRKNISNINSSYAAMYYPWVKITDTVNKKDVFIPPSSQVAAQYAYSDKVADVFYAPAGRTRGTLLEVLATERVFTLGDREALALAGINPIHTESGYGIYIRGQQTLQSSTSALDRVNVRRLLLKLRKVIATASKAFEFEPGDSVTAYRLKRLADTVMEDNLRKGAIQSYLVDVGPNVNTNIVRENNELRMEISLVPTKTAEKIIETYNILPQGGGVSLL